MAQAPAQPPVMQIPDPTLWQCHICKDEGPIKYASQKICATCNHKMCGLCKKDDAIPPPISTATARVRTSSMARTMYRGIHAQDPDIWPTSQVPRPGPTNANTNNGTRARYRATHSHKLTSRPSRPSPRGWWRCSECKNVNNPALTDRRCTTCNHTQCPTCTNVRVG